MLLLLILSKNAMYNTINFVTKNDVQIPIKTYKEVLHLSFLVFYSLYHFAG